MKKLILTVFSNIMALAACGQGAVSLDNSQGCCSVAVGLAGNWYTGLLSFEVWELNRDIVPAGINLSPAPGGTAESYEAILGAGFTLEKTYVGMDVTDGFLDAGELRMPGVQPAGGTVVLALAVWNTDAPSWSAMLGGVGPSLCGVIAFVNPTADYTAPSYVAPDLSGWNNVGDLVLQGACPIETACSPTNGGTITAMNVVMGMADTGLTVTLSARSNAGFAFSGWTENGAPVSSNASYTFAVTGARDLVANFVAVGPTAVFVQEDGQTRGNWRQAYGAQGYVIAGEATNAPAGVTLGPITGQFLWPWADPTNDWRALVKPGVPDQRIAACWASDKSFSIDLDLGSGVQQVALYCLDYDQFQGGRTEQVDIVDLGGGTNLDSEVVSHFVGGKYLVWNMSGKVRINVTTLETNGANAVLSGIFFGPGTNDAAFVAEDRATQGNWKQAYGAKGYLIIGDSTNCPNATVGPVSGQFFYPWAPSTSDPRALKLPHSPDQRIAACWASATNFSIDVDAGTNAPARLAVYCLDWDKWEGGRVEQLTMVDPASGRTLSSQMVSNLAGGDYLVWEVIGQVRLNVANLNTANSNANAVVNGIFFGTGRSGARFVGQDNSTQGSWEGNYGSEGYVIARYATNCPGYNVGPFDGEDTWIWTNSTNDIRALQKPDVLGDRIAACWTSGTNFTIDLDTGTNANAQVALYCLDFDQWQGGRAQRVDIVDPESGEVLSSTTVNDFVNGEYVLWNVAGRVQIGVSNVATNSNAVLSGMFFDRPRTLLMPAGGVYGGAVHFLLVGRSWSPYRIEASDDLVNWTPVTTTMNLGGTTEFSEAIIPGPPQRFYRAVLLP